MVGKVWISKARGLLRIYRLLESTMQEGIFDVQLICGQCWDVARASTTRIVAGFTTGLKVSP